MRSGVNVQWDAAMMLFDAAELVDSVRQDGRSGMGGCIALSEMYDRNLERYGRSDETKWHQDGVHRVASECFERLHPIRMGGAYWWGKPWRCSDRDHNARVMGLLFASLIARDQSHGLDV